MFADEWNAIASDWIVRNEYRERLLDTFSLFNVAWDAIPDEWHEIGAGLPTPFSVDEAKAVLNRISLQDFWRIE